MSRKRSLNSGGEGSTQPNYGLVAAWGSFPEEKGILPTVNDGEPVEKCQF